MLRVTRSLTVAAAGATAPEVREDLAHLTVALHQALGAQRGEAALAPVQAGAVEAQLRELLHFTSRTFASGPAATWWSDPVLAHQVAQHLPDVVDAAHRHVDGQIEARQWAIHDTDARTERTGLRYTIASGTDPQHQSPLAAGLRGAAAAAGGLRAIVGPPITAAPAELARLSPQRTLADALRDNPVPRPQTGHPSRVPPPTHSTRPGRTR